MNKNAEIVRFYVLATQLKHKIRTGWDKSHWDIQKERIESIAEHIYGTCILAIAFDSEYNLNLDLNKVIKMLVVHELGEVIIGDITPFDNISPEEKLEKEHKAFEKVLGNLVKKDEYYALILEFDEGLTPEAKFAKHCDKLDADFMSKIYQDMGVHKPLDDQYNNVVFLKKKTQQLIDNGAKTPFDIWYEYDKSLYEDDPIFAEFFEFIKSINTQEIV